MRTSVCTCPGGWIGRGVEFATQPFDLPHRDMVELNRMFDSPVYRWLPAKARLEVEYWAVTMRTDSVPDKLERPLLT